MGERFVVVPVDGGGGAVGERERTSAASDTGGGDLAEANFLGEDSVFEAQDVNAAVPILDYNREPNKYGKTIQTACPTSYLLYLLD